MSINLLRRNKVKEILQLAKQMSEEYRYPPDEIRCYRLKNSILITHGTTNMPDNEQSLTITKDDICLVGS